MRRNHEPPQFGDRAPSQLGKVDKEAAQRSGQRHGDRFCRRRGRRRGLERWELYIRISPYPKINRLSVTQRNTGRKWGTTDRSWPAWERRESLRKVVMMTPWTRKSTSGSDWTSWSSRKNSNTSSICNHTCCLSWKSDSSDWLMISALMLEKEIIFESDKI